MNSEQCEGYNGVEISLFPTSKLVYLTKKITTG